MNGYNDRNKARLPCASQCHFVVRGLYHAQHDGAERFIVRGIRMTEEFLYKIRLQKRIVRIAQLLK